MNTFKLKKLTPKQFLARFLSIKFGVNRHKCKVGNCLIPHQMAAYSNEQDDQIVVERIYFKFRTFTTHRKISIFEKFKYQYPITMPDGIKIEQGFLWKRIS